MPSSMLGRLYEEAILNNWDPRSWDLFKMEEKPPDPDDDDDPPEEEEDKGAKDKTFTQAQVDKMMAREKSQGKRSALREFAEEHGIKDPEELKDVLKRWQETKDSQKDDATKNAEQAQKDKAEADRIKADAARERLEIKYERALVRAKIDDKKLDRALRLIDIEDDDDAETITDKVNSLVEDEPSWFDTDEESDGKQTRRLPDGDPKGSGPRRKQGGKTSADKAKEVLQRRHADRLAKTKS